MENLCRIVGVIAILALVAGCRTYGGYNSEEATYQQILIAIDELEAETSDFERRLGAVRSSIPVDELDRLANSRSQLVAEYRQIADRLSGSSSHRELRRIYGAIISDRQILNDHLTRLEMASSESFAAPVRHADLRTNYQIVPVFYHRIGMVASGRQEGALADTTASQFEIPESSVVSDTTGGTAGQDASGLEDQQEEL
jgi:hypothetical protein